jgi:protease-4
MIVRALLLVVTLTTSGCVIPVGGFGFLEGPRPLEETVVEGEGRDKILLMDVTGVITDEPSKRAFGLVEEESTLGRVQSELKKAREDDRVKALVVHINSPGGGVTASDQIYSEIVRWKKEKGVPVVASLGDLAASGGYYVACAADRIVAYPTAVTGSIGVIMMGLNLEGLLAKIGVKNQTFKAGEYKDMLSPLRGATPEERRIIQTILDSMRARFVAVVKESRPRLDQGRFKEVTDGRILTATQALEAGLVDDVADLREALADAKQAAQLERAKVIVYARPPETRENIYSRAPAGPVQVNVLPVDLAGLAGSGPRFMYLWAPGVGE